MTSDDELVTIERFLFVGDAELARAALESSGIDAVLADENIVRLSWGDAVAHGGVRLQVRRRDAALATALLTAEHLRAEEIEEPEQSYLPERTEACRRCGSEEIYPAQEKRKFYAQSLVFVFAGIVLIRFAAWLASVVGVTLPRDVFNVALLVVVLAPFLAALITAISPRMRCRNCGLEWRGRGDASRPSSR